MDADGSVRSVPFDVWAVWFETSGRKRVVAQICLPDGSEVSTVFLGIDHGFGFGPQRPPLIFETMVFGGEFDGEQSRYSTRDEAIDGHNAMVKKVLGLDD